MDRFATSIFIAWALVTASLGLAWARNSLETAPHRRVAELYLWLFTVPLLCVGVAYYGLGLGGLVAVGTLHLALLLLALHLLGRGVGSSQAPVRLAGGLLILGSTFVWLGAITWPGGDLPAIAANPAGHTATAGLFLLGTLLTLAGFVALRAVLRSGGDAWLSELGLAGFHLGAALWAVHLVFRVAVALPVAEGPPPAWFEPVQTWAGGLYAIYMVLAYLAIAAFGVALLRTRWVSRSWGRGLTIFGIVAAVLFVTPAGGPFRPPLMVQFAPYAVGILLLRKLIVEARSGKLER